MNSFVSLRRLEGRFCGPERKNRFGTKVEGALFSIPIAVGPHRWASFGPRTVLGLCQPWRYVAHAAAATPSSPPAKPTGRLSFGPLLLEAQQQHRPAHHHASYPSAKHEATRWRKVLCLEHPACMQKIIRTVYFDGKEAFTHKQHAIHRLNTTFQCYSSLETQIPLDPWFFPG